MLEYVGILRCVPNGGAHAPGSSLCIWCGGGFLNRSGAYILNQRANRVRASEVSIARAYRCERVRQETQCVD